MTPLDFLDFRDFLFPASGWFQSAQFRLIEIRLGLARGMRSQYAGKPFDDTLTEVDQSRIATAERGPKLIDQLDRWLSRTPFVHRPDYDFSLEYRKAVKQMLEDDAARVRANAAMGPAAEGGRSQTDRSLARGIPSDIRAGVRPSPLADVARRRAGRVVHHRLSRPAGAATAVPPARRVDERR